MKSDIITPMYFRSKRITYIILFITALLLSRTMFVLFNDPEGPNLLVIIVGTLIIFFLSLLVYFFKSLVSFSGLRRILLSIFVQIAITALLYLVLK